MHRRSLLKAVAVIVIIGAVFVVLQKVVKVESIFQGGGVIALAATIFAETGLLIGFFLPGDTLLFASGFFAAQGKLELFLAMLALFVGGVLGNMLGYEIGRRSGPRLFNRPDSVLFHKDNVDKARAFFQRHGGKTVVFARFIPVVRTLSPPLAGIGNMPYGTFLFYTVLGALLWVPPLTLIGFWAGRVLGRYINIDHYLLPAVLLATFFTFGISFLHVLRDPISRQKLKQKLQSLK